MKWTKHVAYMDFGVQVIMNTITDNSNDVILFAQAVVERQITKVRFSPIQLWSCIS